MPLTALTALALVACAAPAPTPQRNASPISWSVDPATGQPYEVLIACPGYQTILRKQLQSIPKRVRGIVTLRLVLAGGKLVDVLPVSGPPEYLQHAVAAARHIECRVPEGDSLEIRVDLVFAP